MKRASAFVFFVVAALLLAIPAGASAASLNPDNALPAFAGQVYYDMATNTLSWQNNPAPLADVDIYNNTFSAPPNFSISSTDLNAQWGDEVTTTGTGTLDQHTFSVYNSSSSAGPLVSFSVQISLFDGPMSTFLGSYSISVPLSTPLPVGSYLTIAVVGLSPLGINFPSTDVMVLQQITAHTGAADRLGVAGFWPPTVGVGSLPMYINASTFGPAGFYTVTGIRAADPGYRLGVLKAVPTKGETWGGVKGLYHK